MDEDAGSGVLGEIRARLAAAVQARGESLPLPPLLILGTSERVGSNWVSDTLRPVLGQHNEPFRQQLRPDHPWSALNPRFAGTGHAEIGPLGRHWLVSFAVAKYGPARQAVKETNLFFALPALLALLPGAPVLVLSRSPAGCRVVLRARRLVPAVGVPVALPADERHDPSRGQQRAPVRRAGAR